MTEENEIRAFPLVAPEEGCQWVDQGMTLRDYFAAKALSGFAQGMTAEREEAINNGECDASWEASLSYSLADAMMEARKK